jgi:RecB family exonuclease
VIRRVTIGEYQPCLERELLEEVRSLKDADPLATVVIAVPTNILGLHLSRYIARELGGHAEIRTLTLLDLARRLGEGLASRGEGSALPPQADTLMLRQTIETCLDDPGRSYFGRVAATAGFLRVLLSAFSDLKEGRLTSAELERAVEASTLKGPASAKMREVVALWRAYEARKSHAGFFDRTDLMRAAADAAASSAWLAGVKRLLFYGFYDLNPLQRLLLRRCADVTDTVVLFPFVDGHAFDYARPTLEWLAEVGFETAAAAEPPPGARPPVDGGPSGLRGLREALFARPSGSCAREEGAVAGRDRPREGACEGVVLLSAAGEESECREIAREVLRRAGLSGEDGAGAAAPAVPARGGRRAAAPLEDGLRANEVGVLLREPSRYVAPMCEILQGIGMEPYVREGLPLARTRAGRSLVLLAELLESDLSRREVMDFLTFAELNAEGIHDACGDAAPAGSLNPAFWDHLSKDLGVVQGVEQWRVRLSSYIRSGRERGGGAGGEGTAGEDAPVGDAAGEDAPVGDAAGEDATGGDAAGGGAPVGDLPGAADVRDRAAAGALLALVEVLSAAGASLRSPDAPSKMVRRLSSLYSALVSPGAERELVLDALGELAALDSCTGSIDAALLLRLSRRHLEEKQAGSGALRGAGPVVAGLMAARGLPFKVVAVPGLVEGLFPAVARQDPILLDGERRALNAALAKIGAAGSLALKSERAKEERLLFRLAVGSASHLLVLSYTRADPASGAERLPSEFVLDAATALTGGRCDLGSLDGLPFHRRIPLASLFPDDGSFIDGGEYDLMAAAGAVAGETGAVKYLEGGDTFFKSALEAERRRWDEFRLTPYDGVMEAPSALRALRDRLGGPGVLASPTSIERYCECPFLYFMRYILHIEALDDPEDVLAIPPRDLGSLAHKILERSFGMIFSEGRARLEGWERVLLSVAGRVLEAYRRRSPRGLALLRELNERRLVDDILSAVAADLEKLEGYLPWRFEVRYGRRGEGDRADPLELPIERGRRLALGGKIDRVDLNRSDRTARVIDYKTGKRTSRKDNRLCGGTALQLPLYVLGAQHLLGEEAEVVDAQYYFVSGAGAGDRSHFTARAVEERMGDLLLILRTAARGVERGLFFAYPGDSCGRCEYKAACAPAQALFERKRTDPRAQEFLRMKDVE